MQLNGITLTAENLSATKHLAWSNNHSLNYGGQRKLVSVRDLGPGRTCEISFNFVFVLD